jgi:hypothetical protein
MNNTEFNEQRMDGVKELARRIAAAYTSYVAGYAGVDYVLKKYPGEVGSLWLEVAELLFRVMSASQGPIDDLQLAEIVTKYIQ